MAGPPDLRASEIDGSAIQVALIGTRWNGELVERLLAGARRAIDATGASAVEYTAPGAFELPFAARALALSGRVDAVVVVGAVIRGETTHYEIVSEGCAEGVMATQLSTGIPIGFGVLTVENEAQGLARSEGPGGHNVGEEATIAAIEMALLARDVRP